MGSGVCVCVCVCVDVDVEPLSTSGNGISCKAAQTLEHMQWVEVPSRTCILSFCLVALFSSSCICPSRVTCRRTAKPLQTLRLQRSPPQCTQSRSSSTNSSSIQSRCSSTPCAFTQIQRASSSNCGPQDEEFTSGGHQDPQNETIFDHN